MSSMLFQKMAAKWLFLAFLQPIYSQFKVLDVCLKRNSSAILAISDLC
jgi:hypothetical protein